MPRTPARQSEYQIEMEQSVPESIPVGKIRTIPPTNLLAKVRAAALVAPTYKYIAARLGVTEKTFAKWREQNRKIDLVIDHARAQDIAEIIIPLRERAIRGDIPASKKYIETVHPDLAQPDTQVNVQINQLEVLPAPGKTFRKPHTLIGEKSND